jgi:protein phosphatase
MNSQNQEKIMQCAQCNNYITNTQARFCPNCGQAITKTAVISRDHLANLPTMPLAALAHSSISISAKLSNMASPKRDHVANLPTIPLTPQTRSPKVTKPLGYQPSGTISADKHDTIPLTNVPQGFMPLPKGAIISISDKDDEFNYWVQEIRNQSPKLNVYSVETLDKARLCINVACSEYEIMGNYCSNCGQPASEYVTLRYLLKESNEAAIFASTAQLHQLEVHHAGLLIYQYFEGVMPYDINPHFYLLEPEPGPTLANTLKVPQELATVLIWGQQLAQSLDYLHQLRLVWQSLTPYHVAIEGKQARWVNFTTRFAQQESDYQRDVQALAQLLFYLATGFSNYSPNPSWPEGVKLLFDQTLRQATIISAKQLAETIDQVLTQTKQPPKVELQAYGQTHTGMVRDHNEDSWLVQTLTMSNLGQSQPLGLYVVADGMGGHAAGEIASGLVVETLAHKFATEFLTAQGKVQTAKEMINPTTWLQQAILAGNQAVYQQAKQKRSDMGTTVVATLIIGDTAYISHVGDSRLYLLNQTGIKPLTTDHSLVERLVALGQLKREDAHNHPQSNVIYRTMGDNPQVEVDLLTQPLVSGDYLLLCSDGLTGMVTDSEIYRLVRQSNSLSQAVQQLIGAANEAGGNDNITVILVHIALVA